MSLDIRVIPVLEDNYSYLLMASGSDGAIVVDPGDGERVYKALEREGRRLEAILATHHHFDHVAGIEFLCSKMPVTVYCSTGDVQRVPLASHGAKDGEGIEAAGLRLRVLHVPGHTLGHVAYLCEDALFVGDTLFLGGCGRLFEGSAAQLFESLYRKLLALPDDTRVYPGHEYTVRTRSFCLSIEPGNQKLKEKLEEAKVLCEKGLPTVPGLLQTEKETNVFLRCREPTVIQSVLDRLPGTQDDPVSVFAALRSMMDAY